MRPNLMETMLQVAAVLARRATCRKLAVGCVLTDGRGRIQSTGYNGTPRGLKHCTDEACPGACAPKGSDLCEAVHAEQNALLQCKDVNNIYVCYVTHFPCMRCVKTLLNTGCQWIVVPHSGRVDDPMPDYEPAAYDLWVVKGKRKVDIV